MAGKEESAKVSPDHWQSNLKLITKPVSWLAVFGPGLGGKAHLTAHLKASDRWVRV